MHRPVEFGAEREALVRFIEETPPERIVEETYRRLRGGASAKELLHAAALAVTRSTDLPPGHHGGPLHPVAGLHAVYHTAARLPGEQGYVPIIQSVALANRHIHDPQMGPYILPQIKPLAGGGVPESLDDRPAGAIARGPARYGESGEVAETRAHFLAAAERHSTYLAEHHFAWLLPHQSPVACLDDLLTVAIPKNEVDDHYFIYPVFTYRALELFGWDHADVLLRPVARYVTRKPARPPEVAPFRALIAEYDLLNRPLRQRTGVDETARVGALGEAIGRVANYPDIPEMLARALADGLSLEGAGEALSIGASILFCRSYYGNPMDVHMHTGVNLRRYLLGLEGLSLENKLLALFLWQSGPEVRVAQKRMFDAPEPTADRVAALPHRDQAGLLDALTECIENQPPQDSSVFYGYWEAKPEVKDACALAQQYLDLGYDPEALIVRLAEICCRDNFTEMHAYKHHQAAVEEYRNTRAPWRNRHLIGAARAAAVSHGVAQDVYDETRYLIRV